MNDPVYQKEYRETHKEHSIKYRNEYRADHPEYFKEYRKKYYAEHKEELNQYAKRERIRIQFEVFSHYCNGIPYCQCPYCEETNIQFLTIDHIDNKGNEQRRKTNCGTGAIMYRWLRDNAYPEGYQVLCFNCNSGKFRNSGICPHEIGNAPDTTSATKVQR